MATSGTYLFNPQVAELMDEAFERARIDPAKITARHILSARRSMRYMLADWSTQDYHNFRIDLISFNTVQGVPTYTAGTDFDPDENLVEIIDMVLRRAGTDTPVEFMTRSDYLNIPDKDTEGRPDRCFVDKQRDRLQLTFWTTPENDTDEIIFYAVRKYQDTDTAADNADIPQYMYDAFCYGLAFRLAEKYSPPELEAALFAKAQNSFRAAQNAVRERGPVRIVAESGFRRRRGSAGRYR